MSGGDSGPTPAAGSSEAPRRVLLLAHTGRAAARSVALLFLSGLTEAGLIVRLSGAEAADLGVAADDYEPALELLDGVEAGAAGVPEGGGASADCELAIVLGGDGSILRAAEVTREHGTPVLGVNLGHVGFLAEAEPDDVESTIAAVIDRRYAVEDRLTLDVRVYRGDQQVATTFAVNEAAVEKASRERMLEVVVEIDGRPLSRWGCDGVVVATPTGSTAYNFSAGGPIVWPEVEALCLVPISAHALFARALVVAPTSLVALEVIAGSEHAGVLWCDGRRTVELPPGARIEVRRGERPVRLARLHDAPFTDRLVAKFGLPVSGWRGTAEQRRNAP